MKICTIIGARPQFIKAAAVSALFAQDEDCEEIIIHTGQHYDEDMSKIFFDELGIPKEKYNLSCGSGSHGAQTGLMLSKLEKVLIKEEPDIVLVYGDTNSTLAGTLAGVKLHIPIAHVEAGMRSFNRKMAEEINRVVTDHVCELNFCSTPVAVENLNKEGRGNTAVLVGDVMYDCAVKFAKIAEQNSDPLAKFALEEGNFILLTCHRAENTNYPDRLAGIVNAVNAIAENCQVFYPAHPRTGNYLKEYGLTFTDKVKIVPPVSYFEILGLLKNAKILLTDSGGMQKEAFFFNVPCVTMRDETEWLETVEAGWNQVVGADELKICDAVTNFTKSIPEKISDNPYGNGQAAEKIVQKIKEFLNDHKS